MNIAWKITVLVVSAIVCMVAWPVISKLPSEQYEHIGSSVSTISGVLFGFVLASVTLFASAKDNTLIKNATMTGYMSTITGRLHWTMGLLLGVCVLFMLVLFLPDDLKFKAVIGGSDYRWSSVVVLTGVFLLINAFSSFVSVWISFREFVKFM